MGGVVYTIGSPIARGPVSRLGCRLKELREARGWSQSELGRLSGVSQATINELESGKVTRPRASTLQPLAETLGVSVDVLLGRKPPPEEPIPLRGLAPDLKEALEAMMSFPKEDREAFLGLIRAHHRADLARRRREEEEAEREHPDRQA